MPRPKLSDIKEFCFIFFFYNYIILFPISMVLNVKPLDLLDNSNGIFYSMVLSTNFYFFSVY
jgi:hypothetical protein